MTDATSRARAHEVIAGLFLGGEIEDLIERRLSDYDRAALLGGLFAREDLALYDTRTHVAVPREPEEEMVERVMRAIDNTYDLLIGGDISNLDQVARAAIAALVQGQTQGGEDEQDANAA